MLTAMALLTRLFRVSGGVNASIVRQASTGVGGASGGGTLNEVEVDKFRPIRSEWWDKNGVAKGLHAMNNLRAPLVRDGLISTHRAGSNAGSGPEPLSGVTIVDVGCGGGILSEAVSPDGRQGRRH